jgi:RNA polymerase sigma factor (sigma-70 family)
MAMLDEGSSLQDLIRRVRSGDPDAATAIVLIYQPHVLRAVRLRMRDARLRLALEPADICQSVMASFFARVVLGQFDIDSPERLLRLLDRMARNKVATRARKAEVVRREIRELVNGDGGPVVHAASTTDPARVVASRDLLEQFLGRMSGEERRLAELRSTGYEWSEISEQVGGSPGALRKRLARALDRICTELGIDEHGG